MTGVQTCALPILSGLQSNSFIPHTGYFKHFYFLSLNLRSKVFSTDGLPTLWENRSHPSKGDPLNFLLLDSLVYLFCIICSFFSFYFSGWDVHHYVSAWFSRVLWISFSPSCWLTLFRLLTFFFFLLILILSYLAKLLLSHLSSVQLLSLSDCLWPYGLQHARLPCPSPTLGACSNSCPSSWWCHPTISSSVIPFSCLQAFPALESFPMSQLIAWCGQSTGVWALASFLPKKSQGWSPSEWTGWISLQSKGLKSLLQHHVIFLFGRSHWIMKRV